MRASHHSRQYTGLLYILPWIVGFLVFMAYPLASSLYFSFTNLSPLSTTTRFVGLSNFISMFTKDPDFFPSLRVTFLYALMAVPGRVAIALIVALVLAVDRKGVNILRTAYYLPSIFGGSVAISVLWRFVFQREGLANNFLGVFLVPKIDWLGNPHVALITLAFIPVWQFGSSMVLFLAALKQVPRELYESVRLDGAGALRSFRSITVPMISPIILFNLIMQSVACLQEFTSFFVVTAGGPNKSTYVYAYKLYLEGFSFFKMGYASALSWILFLVILAITFVVFKSSTYWAYYDDRGGL
jgi:oligogalacturonide transport system permease protein